MLSLKLMILLCTINLSEQNVISTAQGKLRGVNRGGYTSYSGIPYATLALDNGRFKRAGLAPSWSGIRDSRQSLCLSGSLEDCLQLDVHTPIAAGSNWPVLVWVTGGTGSYNPGKLVLNGIIAVVVHHRPGPFGFICTDVENIPGNAGVKDVVLALRWVRDNIVAFKGSPAKVVVGGQSFGAAMVEALTLSPMASGLYHGIVLQSGSILCPWAFNYDSKIRASILLDLIPGNEDDAKGLLDATVEDIAAKYKKLNVPYFPFGICIESPMKKEERFLSGAPYDLLSLKKESVPMIIGFNDNEAYVFASLLNEARILKAISRNITFLLPDELKFMNEREQKQVTKLIEDMYFKKNISMASILTYHRDAYFASHIHRSVRFHTSSSNSQIYYYQFKYSSDLGIQEEPGVAKSGAAHSDELAYLFNEEELEGEDAIVEGRMIKFWTNFVKFLNPTPFQNETTWKATTLDHMNLLEIGTEIQMSNYPYSKAVKMWDNIYEKYYYARNRITT